MTLGEAGVGSSANSVDWQPLMKPTFGRRNAGAANGPLSARIANALNAALVWAGEPRPIGAAIARQLRARPRPPDSLWGDVPGRLRVARIVCRTASDNIGWPNDHFIPDDPADVVFYSYRDGLDLTEAVIEIELRLNIKIADDDVPPWFDQTLGEVVDWLLGQTHTRSAG